MNKAEIIRKISKKAGVPDIEAKKFFEIFLKHVSGILKSGESLNIPGVGFFQLRVGQIESSIATSEVNFIYSDLIVFIHEGEQELKEGEEIIFNVPSGIEEEYQPIDSYFSLSIGKPIIPLKGVKATEFFIPPSGTELRNLLESKVSRLIDESEKVTGGKGTETILLKSKNKSIQIESNVKEEKVPDRSEFLKTREFENLSWDFGENLSQEIEEESILDSEKDETTTKEIKPEEEWLGDIEEIPGEEDETEPDFEEDLETLDENQDEEIFEEVIDEDDDNKAGIEGELREEGTGGSEPEEMINEKEIVQETVSSENELPGEEKVEESEAGEPFLKNFQRVSSLTKEFNTNIDEDIDGEPEADTSHRRINEVRGGFQKVRRTTAEFDFDLSHIKGPGDEDEIPETKSHSKSSKKPYRGYRKQSTIPSLIIAFVVVIALAGIIFMYLKLKNENHEIAGTNKTGNAKQQTKVIDRNYDVPVTYPYDSTKEKKPEDIKKDNPASTNKDNVNLTDNSGNETKSTASDIREPVNAQRIENYIYKYAEGLVVQVSSWKSESIALKEVGKYRNAGYTAFAEKATIPGMGLYYRVRVGYFSSLNEARKFANGNQ